MRAFEEKLCADMVGSSSGAKLVTWDERDAMLYALGVGAGLGAPASELEFTTENSGGIALQAIPSFLTILAAAHKPPALQRLDAGQFLHGEQFIELLLPLPPAGRGFVCSTVESVLDKGDGAILVIASTLYGDDEQRHIIGRGRMSIFVRGAGGFGGPRGTAAAFELPVRGPDVRIRHQIRPEQALLYRLSGDRHRLHSDPRFARDRGFDRPILHGLCTYGFACRALIEAVAVGHPNRLRAMDGRFRKPVYPGDTVTTEIWCGVGGQILFQTLDGNGEAAIERGTALFAY